MSKIDDLDLNPHPPTLINSLVTNAYYYIFKYNSIFNMKKTVNIAVSSTWLKWIIALACIWFFIMMRPEDFLDDIEKLNEDDVTKAVECAKEFYSKCTATASHKTRACRAMAKCVSDSYATSDDILESVRQRAGARIKKEADS